MGLDYPQERGFLGDVCKTLGMEMLACSWRFFFTPTLECLYIKIFQPRLKKKYPVLIKNRASL